MANSSDLKLISPNELDELLGRAQAERWSELALFGPADRLSQSREEWPDAVKVYRQVFQLSAYAKGLAAKLRPLTSLTSLNLSSNSIGDEGAQHIGRLASLTSLDLSDNDIGDEAAKHIAPLANFTSLDLSFNSIGPEAAKHIARLAHLASLDLSFNNIGPEGAKHIAALANLTSLQMSFNSVGDEGAKRIAGLANLTSLRLSSNSIGDDGAGHIAGLANLTSLDLSFNSIGEEGVSNLLEASASAPRADRLRQLDLRSNGDFGELLPPEALETSNAQAILADYRRYRTALEKETNWLPMTVRQVLASRRWHRWRAWFGRYVR